MSIADYIKGKILIIILNMLLMTYTYVFLRMAKLNVYTSACVVVLYLIIMMISFVIDYIPKRKYYTELLLNFEALDRKYLIAEMLDEPTFTEGKLIYSIINGSCKSMNDEISKYSVASKEYREYIELWIHEVKTPIASSKLIIENNKNEVTQSLCEELDSVDYYLEQALYYSRSKSLEKDYIIRKASVKDMVYAVMRKNSKLFIKNRIGHEFGNLDISVYTDEKWMEYVINQIVINSIKYMKEDSDSARIEIDTKESNDNVILSIKDNGIGIAATDIKKVFDKGYTGSTGRRYAKSTGLGLYLAKNMCNKMGTGLTIESVEGEYTTVKIVFPKNEYVSPITQ